MNQNLKRTAVWLPMIVALTFVAGLLTGAFFFSRASGSSAIDKINTIMKHITAEYVEEVDTDSLLEQSIPDILAKLDPHTSYLPVSEVKTASEELNGKFSGIGISFNMLTDTITVIEVISGGPSEKVGLMPGDRIITINDSVAAGKKWTNEKVISSLRGDKGTTVKLGVQRSTSPKLLEYTVTRGDIPVSSIDASYMLTPTTGYVKVNKFGSTTYNEFFTSLVELRAAGAKSFVIDLRGNGGGYMEMAILMANEFLPAGRTIVSSHGRTPESETIALSDGTGSFQDVDVTVLLDEFSASASEIVAGALQDNDRGLIIGRRSFGKGLVQRPIELPDHSAIRLTTARYYTPSGRCIQKTYTPGSLDAYGMEIVDRYNHGEAFNADSITLDKSHIYHTLGGREVYGGGGIMPDVFVPNDTTGVSTYYLNTLNAGLMHKYAFHFVDPRRTRLSEAKDVKSLMAMLPSDDALLQDFADFAYTTGKIAPRWYYINLSRDLIVSLLKGLIARDVLGSSGYYEIVNASDPTVLKAIKEIEAGNARTPVTATNKK
ncbi:MAG: S41 family peptidase [Muribaculaceae bacterium]|nr:S41 family peptidase [Muribaculaceae bacterium]